MFSNWKEKFLQFMNNESTVSLMTVSSAVAGVSAALLYYYLTAPKPFHCITDFDCQSIELPGPERIHVNALHPEQIDYLEEDVRTIPALFKKGVQRAGDNDFLGWRTSGTEDYKWMSYNQADERAYAVGCGLKKLGFGRGTLMGICAANKPEWVIVDQGGLMFSMVLVPLYETHGAEGMVHIFKKTQLSIVFCDASKVSLMLDRSQEQKCIEVIITFGPVTDENVLQKCQDEGIQMMTLESLETIGTTHRYEKELPTPEDLALICFTSGTTGNPKGVMLTHANIVSNVAAAVKCLEADGMVYTPGDSSISYLPLSHMYERYAEYLLMYHGAKIGFFRGNIKELVNDIQALRPTMFVGVPRILNALYDKVCTAVSESWLKSSLFNVAMKKKIAEVNRGIIRKDSIWDKLVFRKIQNLLGGRVRFMTSGSAPLSSDVMLFLRAAMGCLVSEGYGQTETTAMATICSAYDKELGHVGPPAPCSKLKLIDLPNLGYFSENGEGEICLKGSSIMIGYYKEPEKTKEALDDDGWLHTGDVGRWLPNGALKIIDRKKHLFKLCQGEYVAPEKIENIYCRSLYVSQCFVTGNSLQYCVVAIVFPDEQYLTNWSKKNGFMGNFQELCNNKEIQKIIHEDMERLGKLAGLSSLEQVKAITLCSELMTVESGLLTPTMKCKRPIVEKHFAEQVDDMYKNLAAKSEQRKKIF